MTLSEEVFTLVTELNQLSEMANVKELEEPITALTKAATEVGEASSRSWLGYHSRVYYQGLQTPPPGAHFSQEWGLKGESWIGLGSTGEWVEYPSAKIKEYIFQKANIKSTDEIERLIQPKRDRFLILKADLVSILTSENPASTDSFLANLTEEVNKIQLMSSFQIIEALRPRGQVITRDMTAMGQGSQVPPHMDVLAAVMSVNQVFIACKELGRVVS